MLNYICEIENIKRFVQKVHVLSVDHFTGIKKKNFLSYLNLDPETVHNPLRMLRICPNCSGEQFRLLRDSCPILLSISKDDSTFLSVAFHFKSVPAILAVAF